MRNNVLASPYDAARQLKNLWNLYGIDNPRHKPLAQTFENLESFATSTLQWRFETFCGFSIEPGWTPPNNANNQAYACQLLEHRYVNWHQGRRGHRRFGSGIWVLKKFWGSFEASVVVKV